MTVKRENNLKQFKNIKIASYPIPIHVLVTLESLDNAPLATY